MVVMKITESLSVDCQGRQEGKEAKSSKKNKKKAKRREQTEKGKGHEGLLLDTFYLY